MTYIFLNNNVDCIDFFFFVDSKTHALTWINLLLKNNLKDFWKAIVKQCEILTSCNSSLFWLPLNVSELPYIRVSLV